MSIKKKVMVGFQDDSGCLVEISGSKTVAIIDTSHGIKKLEVPHDRLLNIHLAVIGYLNSIKFKKLSRITRYSIFLNMNQFFRFLESFKSDDQISFNILEEYLSYLRIETNKNRNGFSIYRKIKSLSFCFLWAYSNEKMFSSDQKYLFRKYHQYTPKIQKPQQNKQPGLSQIFSDCPYNDTEILDSLKKLCIWIINHESDQRDELLKLKNSNHFFEKIKNKSIYEKPIINSVLSRGDSDKSRELYGDLISILKNCKNPFFKERILQAVSHPFDDKVLTEEQQDFLLGHLLMSSRDGLPPKCRVYYLLNEKMSSTNCPFKLSKKGLNSFYISFRYFPLRNLLVPSDMEVFAMQLLLASEKMNPASIKELTLDDVVVFKKGIQFQHKKGRRPTSNQVNLTALHPIGSVLGKTYLRFFKNRESAEQYYNDSDRNKLLNYSVQSVGEGFLGMSRHSIESSKYFEKLLEENSFIRKKLIDYFEGEVKVLAPIFWLITKIQNNNYETMEEEKKFSSIRHKNRDKTFFREDFVSKKTISLSMSSVRQSAITSQDSKIFSNSREFTDPKVIAQLSNHSLSVHNEIYLDRSTAREKIDLDRQFSSRIGELMVSDSEKMRDLVNRTKVYDHNEALEELGLPRTDKSASENIAKKIDALGIDIDLMDSFNVNGMRIFLANKTTTALIIKYLEHIRTNFDDISNDDSPNLTKATLAARDYYYFSSILQKFPAYVRKEGEAYARSLSFKYAKLSDIAGTSNEKK
ncbi:hypothetical protein [Idiomarina abyssalis]|uniref:hypothetical protein n=1 Tax=Idiomarina abyssalis TaxID=86102 RepID=UPI003A9358CE